MNILILKTLNNCNSVLGLLSILPLASEATQQFNKLQFLYIAYASIFFLNKSAEFAK